MCRSGQPVMVRWVRMEACGFVARLGNSGRVEDEAGIFLRVLGLQGLSPFVAFG